jgi:hypothetical protein
MVLPPDLIERIATLEAMAEGCKDQQQERYKETMSRIRRIEDRWNVLLGVIILTLLTGIFNIVLALLKK